MDLRITTGSSRVETVSKKWRLLRWRMIDYDQGRHTGISQFWEHSDGFSSVIHEVLQNASSLALPFRKLTWNAKLMAVWSLGVQGSTRSGFLWSYSNPATDGSSVPLTSLVSVPHLLYWSILLVHVSQQRQANWRITKANRKMYRRWTF